ncbi:MAG TPA: enoyl-CoA hydratase/isomerase family protein [Novosphingobium sp.]|nr:enoyl-CoA hydratase/isomerase family protein [Novosphingobium sp.]
MSEQPHVLVEEDGAIIVVSLNRPEKLNALTGEVFAGLDEALLRLRTSDHLKVMLIQATGRYFCSGVDLKSGHKDKREPARSATALRENLRTGLWGMHRIYDEMEHIEKPIVVAHHAMCMGGGLELSLSCDFRLAAASAGYAFPEGKQGTIPASNGVSRLTRIVGPHWARQLIMADKPADAQRALIMGLVHEVFPDETFREDVMAYCRHLAGLHGETMGAAKLAIELAAEVGRDSARNVERMAASALMLNPYFLERRNAHIATVGAKKQPG